jgi:hypothetical protein
VHTHASTPQVSVDEETFKELEAAAAAEGKTIAHVAAERLHKTK